MHIFNISNPSSPQYVSTFAHVRSCDPVVVNDSVAFVTLRSGNACGGFSNQLDIIDIKNLYNPFLIRSYSMMNPHGLGLDETTLFICEGEYGLKIFDAADIHSIDGHMIKFYQDLHAYDVIPHEDVLILIGNDGLYQYDYSDLADIRLLSQMPIEPVSEKE